MVSSDFQSYETKSWSYAEAAKYIPDGQNLNSEYYYSYDVSKFPYAGNAIIAVRKTANDNNVLAYYVYPCCNNGNNVNDIADPPSDKKTGRCAINVTLDEISQFNVGTFTLDENDSNIAVVDSTKTGIKPLKATITVNGVENELLSESNSGVLYTSVQWAPIDSKEKDKSDDYFALEGQKITLLAQLYDKNGNKVSNEGQDISFTYGKGNKAKTIESGETIKTTNNEDETVIVDQYSGKTDTYGRVTLTLRGGSGMPKLEDVSAISSGYEVALSVISDNVSQQTVEAGNYVNLYWVDLGLTFVPYEAAENQAIADRTTGFENTSTMIDYVGSGMAGTSWLIGMVPVARSAKFDYSDPKVVNRNYTTKEFQSITGIPVAYESDRNSTVTTRNNVATFSSTKVNTNASLDGRIEADILGER